MFYFSYRGHGYRTNRDGSRVETQLGAGYGETLTNVSLQLGRRAAEIRNAIDALDEIAWPGGDCPVNLGTPIVRWLRNGELALSRAGDAASQDWRWSNATRDHDIVAYAVLNFDVNEHDFQFSFPHGTRRIDVHD